MVLHPKKLEDGCELNTADLDERPALAAAQ